MSDKVKPWHQRKPKHGDRGKRPAPIRPGSGKRGAPLRGSRDEEEMENIRQRDWRDNRWGED